MSTQNQLLRAMTKNYYDFQDMRIRYSGRLKIKADDTPMEGDLPDFDVIPDALEKFNEEYKEIRKMETKLGRDLEKLVKSTPEWKGFLKDVKGVGPLMAAVLISEIDITKASNVSKIWQYAGLNPHKTVRGRVKKGDKIVESDDFIKGDKPTKGYLLPYNAYLKKKLLGVLADCFIKSKSPYAEYYYDMKHRLETSTRETTVYNGSTVMWKDAKPAHRDKAAKKYMIQRFIIDYYRAVRTMYGLSVRNLYAEEKFGIEHHVD